jgi:hypothetical protein
LLPYRYSFLDLNTIDDDKAAGGKMRLVKLRNPWGRGEWEGAYGDRSEERERAKINDELAKYFKVGREDIKLDFMDGTFCMPFDAWIERFTSLFVALNFPSTWKGRRTQGTWTGESGGNREMGSYVCCSMLFFFSCLVCDLSVSLSLSPIHLLLPACIL